MSTHDKLQKLLNEFAEQRHEIKSMIKEIEHIREKVDTLIPETYEKRFAMYFEEKVKAITSFYSSLLDMRKEIIKSLKDEIELRRKLTSGDDELDLENLLDIRKYADKVYELQQKKKSILKKEEHIISEPELEELGLDIHEAK